MAELRLHAVQWCAQHGHPVLALGTSDDRCFLVSLAAEDAVAFAALPDASGGGRAPRRLHFLVESTIVALGARLTGVRLHVGRDAILRASLHLHGPAGEVTLPAHFADGVALAHRGRLPLSMADEDLARVPLTPLAMSELPSGVDATPSPAREPALPPEPFRAVIDALDLEGFAHPSEEGGAADAGNAT